MNPRCDEGFKVCSVSNRFSATLMDNPAGAAVTVAPAPVRRRERKVCVLPFIIQSSWYTKLYKCNSLQLHLPHQTDRQTDRQESRNPRCDEGFKVCSVSNRFSAALMDNPAGAAATVAPAAVRRRGRKVCVLPFIIQSSWHQKGWRLE